MCALKTGDIKVRKQIHTHCISRHVRASMHTLMHSTSAATLAVALLSFLAFCFFGNASTASSSACRPRPAAKVTTQAAPGMRACTRTGAKQAGRHVAVSTPTQHRPQAHNVCIFTHK
jgi:hypothetical protein